MADVPTTSEGDVRLPSVADASFREKSKGVSASDPSVPWNTPLEQFERYLTWHFEGNHHRWVAAHRAKKGLPMTLRSYTMELRVDFDDDSKHKNIEEAMKVAAKHVFTIASLIADRRKPQIALHGSDFFAGTDVISLADDIPQDDNPEGNDERDAYTEAVDASLRETG